MSRTPGTSASIRTSASQAFAATGFDAYGNAVAPAATWTLSSSLYGRLSRTTPTSLAWLSTNEATPATSTTSCS